MRNSSEKIQTLLSNKFQNDIDRHIERVAPELQINQPILPE